jgi:type I restriction-modification system DNA methylase subunit
LCATTTLWRGPYISYTQSDRVDIVLTNPPFGGREEDVIESNFPKHFQTRETADLFLALIIRLLKPGGRAAVVLPDGTLFGEGVKTRLKEHLMEECNLHTIVRLAQFRVQALCLDRHQLAVFREKRADEGHLVL